MTARLATLALTATATLAIAWAVSAFLDHALVAAFGGLR